MKIKETTTIELSKKELTDLIKKHLITKGYDVKDVSFNTKNEYDDADWEGRYGPTTVFDNVSCTVKKECTQE